MGEAGEGVIFDKLVAVGGVNERYVEPLGGSVDLRLLEAVARWVVFRFSLYQGYRNRLGFGRASYPQGEVSPAGSPLSGYTTDNLYGTSSYFPPD